MIQWIDTPELKEEALSFCAEKLCGTRISSFLEAYGTDYQFARFWAQKNDGNIAAVLSCVDGIATLEADVKADFEELSIFLSFSEMKTLFSEEAVAKRLPLKTVSRVNSMVYRDNIFSYDTSDIKCNPDLKDVYGCLSSSYGKDDLPPFEEWLPDVSYRIRHKTASVFAIKKNNTCVSVAMAVAESPSAVILGGIATKPQFRNRGYAKSLVSHCTKCYTEENKKLFLCCDESKIDFYKKLGFEQQENYSISVLK